MAHLFISLLGPLRVTLDGAPVAFKSNKARALLAYLAVEARQPHRREVLAGLLWPDWPDRDALSNLRYTLSDLRQAISDRTTDPPFLLVSRDELQFNPASDCSLDVTTLLHAAEDIKQPSASLARLQQAVALYQRPFLDGFSLSDCPSFEQWVLWTRERLDRQISALLHHLAAAYEQGGEFDRAQAYAWRQLELEPCDESAHQLLMRTLALSDQRAAALAQYQTCRRLLAEELAVEPSAETTRLYEQIREGSLRGPALPPRPETATRLPRFLELEPPAFEGPVVVARERELAQLEAFLSEALAGQGRVIFVTGEVGSGKTALLHEFSRRALAEHEALAVAGGLCNAYTGVGDPYSPFREILGLLAGDVEARWAAGAISREHGSRLWNTLPGLAEAVMEAGPDLIDTFLPRSGLLERARTYAPSGSEWLKRLIDLVEGRPQVAGPFNLQQNDLFEQYTRVLVSLSRHVPLLLFLDDLQWADAGSISLLFHLGRHLRGSRILVLGAYRPEEVTIGRQGARHPLEPVVNEFQRDFGDMTVGLGQAESRDFVDALLDSEPNDLSPEFRDLLFRQTRGQPLFTRELLRGLQERGDLVQDAEGRWVEGPKLDWDSLPARVEAVVAERIGRLSAPLQTILLTASVEGEVFTAEVVARATAVDEHKVLRLLSGELDRHHYLVRAHSIQRIDGQLWSQYRFRHILFQRYLYSSQDEVERVYAHERVGTALESLCRGPEQATEIAVQLALHFREARIADKAVHYLRLAGDKAIKLSAYQEARAHLTQGLKLLESLPESPRRLKTELGLQLSLGLACMGSYPAPDWEQAITRARELSQQAGETDGLCAILGQLAIVHYVRANYREARELGQEALRLAEQRGDPLDVAVSHWYLGFIHFGMGEFVRAHAHLSQTISFYQPQRDHQRLVLARGADAGTGALAYDACCLWCLGYIEQASHRRHEGLVMARQLGHAFSLTDALMFGGCLFGLLGHDVEMVRASASEMAQISKRLGFASFWTSAVVFEGLALAQLGDVPEGIAQTRKAIEERLGTGTSCQHSHVLGSLAEAYFAAGQPVAALEVLDEALSFVKKTGERYFEAELHRLKASALRALGDEAAAEANLQFAIEVAARQSARMWELRAAMDLNRLWRSQGKDAEARAVLAPVFGSFTEGFENPDLKAAAALLA